MPKGRRVKKTTKRFGISFDLTEVETQWYLTRFFRKRAFLRLMKSKHFKEMWKRGKIKLINLGAKPPEEEWYDAKRIEEELYPKKSL